MLGQRGLVTRRRVAADVPLGDALEHPDAFHAGAPGQELADQRDDGHVARRVTQLPVLAGRAGQALLSYLNLDIQPLLLLNGPP